jgi:hypothetical protein
MVEEHSMDIKLQDETLEIHQLFTDTGMTSSSSTDVRVPWWRWKGFRVSGEPDAIASFVEKHGLDKVQLVTEGLLPPLVLS